LGWNLGLQVKLTVRIAPGVRARTVVVRELAALKATYAVFDRYIIILCHLIESLQSDTNRARQDTEEENVAIITFFRLGLYHYGIRIVI